jgi:predicted nucleotidyltransferase
MVNLLDHVGESMSHARNDDGQFVEKTPIDEVRAALDAANEPLTAPEIAARLDIPNRTALDKLTELAEKDPTVIRKQVGASAVIWFIRHGEIHEQAFEAFADRLTEGCGEDIEEIILYGSVARGEAHEDSDVDVLVVIEDESARERVEERASTLGFEITMEYGVEISKMVTTKDQMKERHESSFIQSVQNDGQVYG